MCGTGQEPGQQWPRLSAALVQHSADVHGEGGEAGVGTVAEQDGEWQQTSELGDGAAALGTRAHTPACFTALIPCPTYSRG